MTLYQHPNIRDLTAEQIHIRIDALRNQRLITAIEADNARKIKLTKMAVKDQDKYNKLGDRLATRLAKITELLVQCDQDLIGMQRLSSNLGLIETELDL